MHSTQPSPRTLPHTARPYWRLCSLLTALLLAAILPLAHTASPTALAAAGPPADQMRKISHLGGQGFAVTVDAAGEYAYFSAGPVLYAAQITGGQITQTWASSPLSGNIRKIELVGSLAYLAAEQSGLLVLDISDKAAMHPIASYDTQAAAYGLDVVEELVYLTVPGEGLLILDASDLNDIALVNTLAYGPSLFYDVVVKNNFAHVAAYDQGMIMYDISSPTSVPPPFQFDPPGDSVSLAVDVQGTFAYLATTRYIRVVALSRPEELHDIGPGIDVTGDDEANVTDVMIGGSTVYAGSQKGVCAADVNIVIKPKPCALYPYPFPPTGQVEVKAVAASGGGIFAMNKDGLYLLDPALPGDPQTFELQPGRVIDAARSGDRLYVLGAGRLYIYDARDTTRLLGSTAMPGFRAIAPWQKTLQGGVTGHYIFAARPSGGIEAYNVTDPAHIAFLGASEWAADYGSPADFRIANDTLYLLTHKPGHLISFNISDPQAVSFQQALKLPGDADGMRLTLVGWSAAQIGQPQKEQLYAYAALGEDGLAVFDVVQPAAMRLLEHAQFDDYRTITTVALAVKPDGSPGTLYLAGSGDIQILDAGSLSGPRRSLRSRLGPNDLLTAEGAGDYLYAADGMAGVTVFRLDDPLAPLMAGYIELPGYSRRLAASRHGEVYVIDEETGLQQVRLNLHESFIPVILR